VPGWTAESYPHVVEAILHDGHEIGHHGYLHAQTSQVSPGVQAEEIERGFAALESIGAPRPRGYRSPAWEVTPETFELLVDARFLYDSSFMSDDRPYIERHGQLELLELPVHWGLDDWPYFAFGADRGGNVSAAREWHANWWSEYVNARDEGRLVTYTCHPEVAGRAYRAVELERLVGRIRDDDSAWLATMGDVARHVEPRLRGDR
jgi:peptidoglycan/xylan/chitin deacetylase (PgdA/CDA1 family)